MLILASGLGKLSSVFFKLNCLKRKQLFMILGLRLRRVFGHKSLTWCLLRRRRRLPMCRVNIKQQLSHTESSQSTYGTHSFFCQYTTITYIPGDSQTVCSAGELYNNNNSVQFKKISMRSEKPICAPSRLSEVPSTSPLKRFQCLVDDGTLSPFQGRLSSATTTTAN